MRARARARGIAVVTGPWAELVSERKRHSRPQVRRQSVSAMEDVDGNGASIRARERIQRARALTRTRVCAHRAKERDGGSAAQRGARREIQTGESLDAARMEWKFACVRRVHPFVARHVARCTCMRVCLSVCPPVCVCARALATVLCVLRSPVCMHVSVCVCIYALAHRARGVPYRVHRAGCMGLGAGAVGQRRSTPVRRLFFRSRVFDLC